MTHTDRLCEIFFNLIRIDAVSKKEKPVADYIRGFVQAMPVTISEDTAGELIGGDSGNLVCRFGSGSDKPKIGLMAHMDTIKSTRGIRPQVQNGVIRSDGKTILGADNRAGVAIILYALEKLHSSQADHKPFEIIFSIGEETGLYGSIHLDMSLINAREIYIFDSSAEPGFYICHAPGAIELSIRFLGKSSHAAVNPEGGINALTMATDFLHHFPAGQVADHTTINFGRISGGDANNVVPENVTITGEIRSMKEVFLDEYLEKARSLLAKVERKYGGKTFLKSDLAFPAYELDPTSPLLQRLHDSFRMINIHPQAIQYHGGSDANILNNRGLKAVNLGIGAKNPHANDEYIVLADMHKMADLIQKLVVCD